VLPREWPGTRPIQGTEVIWRGTKGEAPLTVSRTNGFGDPLDGDWGCQTGNSEEGSYQKRRTQSDDDTAMGVEWLVSRFKKKKGRRK